MEMLLASSKCFHRLQGNRDDDFHEGLLVSQHNTHHREPKNHASPVLLKILEVALQTLTYHLRALAVPSSNLLFQGLSHKSVAIGVPMASANGASNADSAISCP